VNLPRPTPFIFVVGILQAHFRKIRKVKGEPYAAVCAEHTDVVSTF
jgi:hypothetical protein